MEEQKNLSEQLENLIIDYEILQSNTMDFKNNSGYWGSLQESPDNGKRGHIAKADKRIQMLKKKIRARGGIEINKINSENVNDVAAAGGFKTPLEQLMQSQTEGRVVEVKEPNYKNRIKD